MKPSRQRRLSADPFVDLIACERECRNCSYADDARLRRQLRSLSTQRILSVCQPRRRPEQDSAAHHRAASDPAPGPTASELTSHAEVAPARWSSPRSAISSSGSTRPRGGFDLAAKQARVDELDAAGQPIPTSGPTSAPPRRCCATPRACATRSTSWRSLIERADDLRRAGRAGRGIGRRRDDGRPRRRVTPR